ncbi:MAG: hypothetical protein HYS15_02110 [Candidatus Spechtbacteria bacterium]|nr:hypothetical protein [Candidatus Spechtbacteria bacterium]
MESLVFLVIASQIAIVAIVSGVLKSIANTLPKAKALCLQFAIAAAIAWLAILAFGQIRFELRLLPILAVGAVNAFGAYAQWQALALSLSKTALVTPLGGVLAALLAAIFLDEAKLYQNFWFLGGILLLFFSIFLIVKKKRGKAEGNASLKWLFWAGVMIGIVGIVIFIMKYFAFALEVPRANFLGYWYAGAFLGSLLIAFIRRKEQGELFQPTVWKVPIASLLIFLSLLTQYWALQLVPLGLAVPISSFGGAALTILVGWWVFKERKGLTAQEKAAFILGGFGLAIIIISQQ